MKWLRVALVLLCSGVGYANEPTTINVSSNIAGLNGTGYLTAGYLDAVVIGVPTATGVLELYNSTFTTSVLIASMSLATVGMREFHNTAVKGLFWKIATNTNGVTIIHKKP